MFREDILWLLPALVIALYQLIKWSRLPKLDHSETEISGGYTKLDQAYFDFFLLLPGAILLIQLSINILPITHNLTILLVLRIIGYLLIIKGLIVSLLSLKTLGNNWTGLSEYRIKKGQVLVTSGIYGLIRHPIYTAVIIEIIGFELVANSWLILVLPVISLILFNQHVSKEEALLELKFGQEFSNYKQRVGKFLPKLQNLLHLG